MLEDAVMSFAVQHLLLGMGDMGEVEIIQNRMAVTKYINTVMVSCFPPFPLISHSAALCDSLIIKQSSISMKFLVLSQTNHVSSVTRHARGGKGTRIAPPPPKSASWQQEQPHGLHMQGTPKQSQLLLLL